VINIGKKILAFRRANHLTIRELAEKTGLSTAIISQMERNIANPSLSVLTVMADVVGMKVSELLAEEINEESLILRKKDRQQTYNPDDRYIFYNLLTPGTMNADVGIILVHCEPRSETYGGEFHAHPNEEILLVLTGKLTVILEFSRYVISEGDTMRIPPHFKHRYINDTDEIAELLTIKAHSRL
jgi:transcriptional regulator with XRE-family HTH domain